VCVRAHVIRPFLGSYYIYMKTMDVILTPAQRRVADKLIQEVPAGGVFLLWGAAGMGKTTILKKLQAACGGTLLSTREFLAQLETRHPLAIEEAFLEMVRCALAASDIVIVDDLQMVTNVTNGCRSYPRSNLLDAPAEALLIEAAAAGKTLIFGTEGSTPGPISRRAWSWGIGEFRAADYSCVCQAYLEPEAAAKLDYGKIHRFASRLNAWQLQRALAGSAATGVRTPRRSSTTCARQVSRATCTRARCRRWSCATLRVSTT
jgi:hypothetical protein